MVSKIRFEMESRRACDSCAYVDDVRDFKYIMNVFCRADRCRRPYKIGCWKWKPMSCYNCIYKIKIMKEPKEKIRDDDGQVHYQYYYPFYLNCEKTGRIHFRLKGGAKERPIPSCSLWKWGKHK